MSLANELEQAMVAAVQRWAQITLGVSVKEAPVDTGTLRRSALAVVAKSDNTATATLSYNTEYAAVQHEGVSFEHPIGGKAKYLEDPVKAHAHEIVGQLEQQRDRVLSRWRV